ncbi:hypothetical protein [Tepidiforma sp.]|uniref:hypothetical protein n=1 Tax=Tepidiforma sp. TaxID=2682230 RepID=UPI002ADDD746|nr:hypothetical protein [Tepidiforma sp.]
MPLVEFATDLVFGSLYGAVVAMIALVAAIPYGVWQGLRRLARFFGGKADGDARTGG